LYDVRNNNNKLKDNIVENEVKVKQQNNHMSELSFTVQNLENKIKQNKTKEDYFKGEIKKH
jgi:uncharacterized coiled-coil protein SlyX